MNIILTTAILISFKFVIINGITCHCQIPDAAEDYIHALDCTPERDCEVVNGTKVSGTKGQPVCAKRQLGNVTARYCSLSEVIYCS